MFDSGENYTNGFEPLNNMIIINVYLCASSLNS